MKELKDSIKKKPGPKHIPKEEFLPPDWKETAAKLCSDGCCKEEIFLHFYRLKPSYFDALYERDLELQDIVNKNQNLCKAWWIEQGKVHLKSQYFQSALWFMNMKNRFGWTDKQDIDLGVKDSTIEKLASVSSIELVKIAKELLSK